MFYIRDISETCYSRYSIKLDEQIDTDGILKESIYEALGGLVDVKVLNAL